MEFKFPRIHDISIEMDGRRFEGSWYVILRDMIVNYNGYTASTHERTTDADDVAIEMLRNLVHKHYIRLDSLPDSLPTRIRVAAHKYLNAFDDNQPTQELVSSFGSSIAGSEVHQQLSWLCVNAIGMIVPFWKFMCDSDTPEATYRELRHWLDDPSHMVDWSLAQRPSIAMREGERVADCDACRLEPTADAVANAAAYLRTADPALAVNVLLSAASAYDEGCRSQDAPDRFEKWLAFEALPRACRCEPLAPRQIDGRRNQ